MLEYFSYNTRMQYPNQQSHQTPTPGGKNALLGIVLMLVAILVVVLLVSGQGFQLVEYLTNLLSGRESYR